MRSAQLKMSDVARIAGVSTQTVSRALNNAGRISPETRARVLKVVEDLGYHRNVAARTLVNRRSGIVGIIVSDTDQYAPRLTMLAVESALRAHGYGVSLISYDHGELGQARAAMLQSAAQGVEAILLLGAWPIEISERDRDEIGVPIVSVRGDRHDDPFSVGIDQVAGARLATEYLLARGHETVVHVAGPEDWLDSVLREQGWRDTLRDAGRPIPPVRWRGDWTARSGYEIGTAFISSGGQGSALFVANDQMAMGVCRALIEHGVSVPGDISVVGFDDLPEAGYYSPPLTTVRQNLSALGERAADLALSLRSGNGGNQEGLIVPELVVDRRLSGT
ncbi:LacI family DNA-binding transcriptional regulator [Agromyces aerolatus]|uniref:LacI family DNA-binding transcriptional regulator n=1 Tax=Agromyces sp. LY-1074 TaxID=3074080 RepID=UPI002854F6E8|nr:MULTISPECIES: LacI family DNA-binding transcriptional regulator [unclassified Agromyces]MDR5699472.1 LacI family DNA-binding transcriptional regulator [Agromyces sp. LY-1074]MDR5705768.1 LacI family DNA-binding transcriptional regulator [Agromyces sp. LY-1358]